MDFQWTVVLSNLVDHMVQFLILSEILDRVFIVEIRLATGIAKLTVS